MGIFEARKRNTYNFLRSWWDRHEARIETIGEIMARIAIAALNHAVVRRTGSTEAEYNDLCNNPKSALLLVEE